ncbi:tuftelin-interacting protein 11-like [Haliotis cracherodii]|uniref:tuftelin-interacting protein 11-like n=1 Tax=Haliotis cracherodii TaxID=6455 RepID=UPI0039E9C9BC
MSSPEVERFEVTDRDLEDIFTPRVFRQSKNQAIYGIWAEKEDEEEEERPSFGGGKRKKDYTAPVNFISGGFKRELKKEDLAGSDSNDSGASVPIKKEKWTASRRPFASKGGPVKQATPHFLKGHHETREFGDWEKHTRGIGQRILQKMGYKPGEGLGTEGQGITTPVTAVKRKGKGAIGFHGSERSARSMVDFPVVDSEEEDEKKFQEELHQWKRTETKAKKPKYVYKTAQEAIDGGQGRKKKSYDMKASKVKVIDMTGREQRVLTGYHAISHRHDKPDEEEVVYTDEKQIRMFDMPELLHNLNLLVDMAEEDIILNDRKLKHSKDSVVNIEHEKKRLDAVCDDEEKHLEKLSKLLEVIEDCEKRTQPNCEVPITLDECVDVFKMMQKDYYEEYKLYDMDALAIALVFPLMKAFFAPWEPLSEPGYGFNTVREWRVLLEEPGGQHHDINDMDTYQRLLWDTWLPPVRSGILRWNVRSYDPLVCVLETWQPALPRWIMENILDQLVLPRLLQEVEAWNPLTDTIPVHAWIHPWLPLMADKLEPLYAPIRHKLANALVNWHPSDASAKIILQPWLGVFKQGHMDAFLVKNILPKLGQAIQEMHINPHQQVLNPWRWFMAWYSILPTQHLISVLDKAFFPRWLQVLCGWLSNMPNFDEITKWYLGWKAQFPEEMKSHAVIKEQFNKALEIMNQSVSGHFQPGVRENMAYFTHTERRQMDVQPPVQPPPSQTQAQAETMQAVRSVNPSVPTSFKDLLERKANDNNILFMPIAGKSHEGHQVYRFGNLQIYLDRSVVFMYTGNTQSWVPVSLQHLIDNAIR